MSTATLNWANPTTRTDGAVLDPSAIASVDVFDSADGAAPVALVNLTGAATSFTTSALSVGTHVFTVVVNDTTGHSSAPSNSASGTVVATLAPPSAVSNLSVTINP